MPSREENERRVQAELTGIWKQEKKEDALINLQAFKAKYAQRYPEAVRSLIAGRPAKERSSPCSPGEARGLGDRGSLLQMADPEL